jgi:hypothetical protein
MRLSEVCYGECRYFFGEVERSSQVAADESHIAIDVLFEHAFAALVHKLAMDFDLRGSGNRGDLALLLAARL